MHRPRHVLELQFVGPRAIVRGAPQTARLFSPRPQAAEARREGNVRVRGIWFNHNAESERSDSVTMTDADNNPMTSAEWTDGKRPQPAAYARDATTRTITIKAAFAGGRPGESLTIRAIAERPGVGPVLGAVLNLLLGPSSVLGVVTPREVSFGDNGESDFVSFEIRGRRNPPAVGVYTVRWIWQVQRGGRWMDIETTEHKLFMLAAVPAPPWSRATTAKVWRIPFPAAVELACQWASGANSVEEATDLIAKAIHEHPKHEYDSTADQFADSFPKSYFDVTKYLFELENADIVRIDCRGTAAAVAAFANLLGAELFTLSIANSDGTKFNTKELLPFVSTTWVQFTLADAWTFHEVAVVPGLLPAPVLAISTFTPLSPWPAGFGADQLIYDAIPLLNPDAPVSALKIPLGVPGVGGQDYRFLLMESGAGDTLTPELTRELV